MADEHAKLAKVPKDKDLSIIASYIGASWELMAPFLFETNSTVIVDRIKIDNPGDCKRQIYKLFVEWKQQTGRTATLGYLFGLIPEAVHVEWNIIARKLDIPEAVHVEWNIIAVKLDIPEALIHNPHMGANEEIDGTHETTGGGQPKEESLHDQLNRKRYRSPKDSCIFDGRLIKLASKDIQRLNSECTIQIGEGGFGIVYTSKEVLEGFGIRVALKKILADTREKSKSVRREMMASRILHPFTLPLLAVLERKNSEFWFISPFCENGDLQKAIEEKKVHLVQVIRVRIVWQMSLAIQYLHTPVPNVRDGIVHKDISSRNVVLDERFNARLIDFGLAREIGDQTTNSHGRSLYLHPMVGRGPSLAPENLDYYSFGVVIRELLTGLGPIGSNSTHLMNMSSKKVLGYKQEDIWSESVCTSLNEIAYKCLNTKEEKLDFNTIVIQELKVIYNNTNRMETYDDRPTDSSQTESKQCHICIINPKASDTTFNKEHAPNCTQQICVCIACVKNSFLNPITCYCGTELKPSIGCGWGALLVAGNDTKNKAITEAITKDVVEIKNVITSKAPLIMGISEDKVRMVVPSKPGEPEQLRPKLEEEIKQISEDSDITTLLIYISCHGKEAHNKYLIELGSAEDTISMDDFKTSIETLKNIDQIILFLDCCFPKLIELKDKHCIQINACKEKALVNNDGSNFTKHLINGLKARSENSECTNGCEHCETYWNNRKDLISVASLYEYIHNHMKISVATPTWKLESDCIGNIAFYTDEEILIDFKIVSEDNDSLKKIHLEYFQKMEQLEDKLLEEFQKDKHIYAVLIQKDTYRKDQPIELCDTLEKVMSAWVRRQPLQVVFTERSKDVASAGSDV